MHLRVCQQHSLQQSLQTLLDDPRGGATMDPLEPELREQVVNTPPVWPAMPLSAPGGSQDAAESFKTRQSIHGTCHPLAVATLASFQTQCLPTKRGQPCGRKHV